MGDIRFKADILTDQGNISANVSIKQGTEKEFILKVSAKIAVGVLLYNIFVYSIDEESPVPAIYWVAPLNVTAKARDVVFTVSISKFWISRPLFVLN